VRQHTQTDTRNEEVVEVVVGVEVVGVEVVVEAVVGWRWTTEECCDDGNMSSCKDALTRNMSHKNTYPTII